MTQPVGEPGLDPAPQVQPAPAPGVPAPAPQPTTQPGLDPNAPVDVTTLPANVQKLIADLRHEAGGHRQGKTAAEERLNNVLGALGLNPDGTATKATPEEIAAQLTQRATAAEEALWGATAKYEIHNIAATLGANARALLNSVSFVDSLDELADEDPTTPAFRTALEAKIQAAITTDPNLRAAGRGAVMRQGADITGSGGGGTGRPTSVAAAIRARLNG